MGCPKISFNHADERTSALQNAEDLIASDTLDLGNAVGISEVHTDLRRGETLPGELAAVLDNLGGGDLEP